MPYAYVATTYLNIAGLAVAAQPSEGAKGVYSEALVAKLRRLENAVAAL